MNPMSQASAHQSTARLLLAWTAIGASLLGLALMLVANRHRFDWARALIDIPALPLVAGLVAAGAVFTALLPSLEAISRTRLVASRTLLAGMIAIGLALRLLMFTTEPALEDDQQRYLWEGALVGNGLSPYRLAPEDAKAAERGTLLAALAERSGPLIERVNHPHLKSIYPPVAQAAFAVAYGISPFSLTAWRTVLLLLDCVTLWLLLQLLADAGRTPLWSALYWWNPIVIKEVFNAGHMEGVLVPCLVLAVLLAGRKKFWSSSVALGLAAGIKIWPVLLAPLLFRPLLDRPVALAKASAILGLLGALWVWPIIAGGLDHRSGFMAFAQDWQANSALLPALRDTVAAASRWLGVAAGHDARIARLLLAFAAAAAAILVARAPIQDTSDLVTRAAWTTLAIFLLSPAQFPWYALWTMAFLPFAPRLSVVALAITLPLYYSSFYFAAIDAYDVFRDRVVWLVWLPIWILLAAEIWRSKWKGGQIRPSTLRGS